MVKRKSPLEPSAGPRKRAYELDGMINVKVPQDPVRQIEDEALRDLSSEYRQLRIEEMIAKKRAQLNKSGPMSNTQAQRENLEYFKTVMELAKMNQPKDQPDRTLEYLKFFNQVNQNQGAPTNFFDQYIKGRELGIFGQPSTGDSNTSDVEIEKLRGERMLDSKRIDLELHKLRLETEVNQGKLGMLSGILGPVLAAGGAQVAKTMQERGMELGQGHLNRGNPSSLYNDLLKEVGLQGETGELHFKCPCGYDKVLIVPVPIPAQISCPGCGQSLSTGPSPLGDAETSEQWRQQA